MLEHRFIVPSLLSLFALLGACTAVNEQPGGTEDITTDTSFAINGDLGRATGDGTSTPTGDAPARTQDTTTAPADDTTGPIVTPGDTTTLPTDDVGGCQPTTCEALAKTCGTASDGCDGTLDCGGCDAPDTCGGGGDPNQCGCTAATCQTLDESCGVFEDGCGGTLDCGPCGTDDCDPPASTGVTVALDGTSLMAPDDQKFLGLGATLFWAAWAYKYDQAKLAENLQYLSEKGFNYIRALGVVGCVNPPDPDDQSDYWSDREIKASWADYDAVIAGTTDMAFDQYGIRVQWTLIGDGQCTVPSSADKYDLVDRFLAMSLGREHKIVLFETANEAYQNGFGGADGLAELRAITSYMRSQTDILVAASAPFKGECDGDGGVEELYAEGGCIADIATVHFDRDISKTEGPWRPVRQPWDHQFCDDVPVGSNNEPIGPGASVESEDNPLRLVSAAIVTYISKVPMYVFHSHAGVTGKTSGMANIWEMTGSDAFTKVGQILPPGLSSWTPKNAHWADSVMKVYAKNGAGELEPGEWWMNVDNPQGGVVRAFGSVSGNDFVVYPMGIKNSAVLEPREDMSFEVIDPLTGAVHASCTLLAGTQFTLSGADAYLIKGSWCGSNCVPTDCVIDGALSCPDDYQCPDETTCNEATGNCIPEAECPAETCASLGVSCGEHDNGCLMTIDCGSCTGGHQCHSGACLPSCGTYINASTWSDGICCPDECPGVGTSLGETYDCNYCCEGDQCGCEPLTCAGLDCGMFADGCGGTIDCGECEEEEDPCEDDDPDCAG